MHEYLSIPDGLLYMARMRMQITQASLAKELGVHKMTVWKIENGKQQPRGINASNLYRFLVEKGCSDLADQCRFVRKTDDLAQQKVSDGGLVDNSDILRTINHLGLDGKQFQSRDIRKALGVATSDKGASARIHNYLTELRKGLIVSEVPGSRTRNKYFRIEDANRLNELIGISQASRIDASQPTLSPPGRLTRIEGEVHALQEHVRTILQRLDQLDTRLNAFISMWS